MALLKLATSHLQKKGGPESKPKDGESHNTVYGVWKTLLDETEKIAKARLAATEVYQQQVSEGAKSLRLYKLQVAKKCFESLKKMHEEIQTCVTEIDKSKKLYFEEEHMAHDARDKAHDADEKLKRKKGRIFQSISSLQKNSAKFSFRREACDIQATKARNDYVLALIAANAHQTKFYENDLPELVQYLDCDMYDKVKEYILLIAHTELLTCAACQSSFSIVQEQANTASKQHTMECFFRDNSVLSQTILYEFEPCDNDQINKLSIEHNAALCLSKEARRWISCVAKEVRVIRDSQDELKKLLAQIGDKHPYTLQSDQIGPQAELEARIDELRQIIRKSQTSKKKAEARLEAMKEAGVNVEDWVKTSDTDSVSASDSPAEIFSRSGTVTSRSSRQSYQSNEVFEGSVEVNDAAFYDTVQEAWDAAAETEEIEEPEPTPPPPTATVQEPVVNGEVPAPVPGQRCVALFSYEVSFHPNITLASSSQKRVLHVHVLRHGFILEKTLLNKSATADIKADLLEQGVPVMKVSQLTQRKSKFPLPIFLVVVRKHVEGATDIYDVSKCCYMSIVLDTFRKRPGATQCYNCNLFNHSSVNCFIKPRCLKCSKEHRTGECPIKERLDTPHCINCDADGHTANWRSCPAFPKIKTKKGAATENRNKVAQKTFTSKKANANLSYANAASNSQQMAAPIEKRAGEEQQF
ncbi:protein nervous wreck [Trichonephila clavipes]|nr:protein nervous wreck [Trichonephila clavipes]